MGSLSDLPNAGRVLEKNLRSVGVETAEELKSIVAKSVGGTVMLELLACKLGRNDEIPNIELAEKLCGSANAEGIREIAQGLKSGGQAVANDCVKVLYEIGQRNPALIADYADDFITGLSSKNNRIVWGCMCALACIAPVRADAVYARLSEVVAAYEAGSVITVDNSVSVFACLCKANREYQAKIFPILLGHLAGCRAKEIPQHAERMAVCIDSENREAFIRALEDRMAELSETQRGRLMKLIKRL